MKEFSNMTEQQRRQVETAVAESTDRHAADKHLSRVDDSWRANIGAPRRSSLRIAQQRSIAMKAATDAILDQATTCAYLPNDRTNGIGEEEAGPDDAARATGGVIAVGTAPSTTTPTTGRSGSVPIKKRKRTTELPRTKRVKGSDTSNGTPDVTTPKASTTESHIPPNSVTPSPAYNTRSIHQDISSRSSNGGGDKSSSAGVTLRMGKTLQEYTGRSGASLAVLTERFYHMLMRAPGQRIKIPDVVQELGVQKRRIYDALGVLQGIGLIEREEKHYVSLRTEPLEVEDGPLGTKTGPNAFWSRAEKKKYHEELLSQKDLAREEKKLDRWIKQFEGKQDQDMHMSCQLLQTVICTGDSTSVAISTPRDSVLEIPPDQEEGNYTFAVCPPQESHDLAIETYLWEGNNKDGKRCTAQQISLANPQPGRSEFTEQVLGNNEAIKTEDNATELLPPLRQVSVAEEVSPPPLLSSCSSSNFLPVINMLDELSKQTRPPQLPQLQPSPRRQITMDPSSLLQASSTEWDGISPTKQQQPKLARNTSTAPPPPPLLIQGSSMDWSSGKPRAVSFIPSKDPPSPPLLVQGSSMDWSRDKPKGASSYTSSNVSGNALLEEPSSKSQMEASPRRQITMDLSSLLQTSPSEWDRMSSAKQPPKFSRNSSSKAPPPPPLLIQGSSMDWINCKPRAVSSKQLPPPPPLLKRGSSVEWGSSKPRASSSPSKPAPPPPPLLRHGSSVDWGKPRASSSPSKPAPPPPPLLQQRTSGSCPVLPPLFAACSSEFTFHALNHVLGGGTKTETKDEGWMKLDEDEPLLQEPPQAHIPRPPHLFVPRHVSL